MKRRSDSGPALFSAKKGTPRPGGSGVEGKIFRTRTNIFEEQGEKVPVVRRRRRNAFGGTTAFVQAHTYHCVHVRSTYRTVTYHPTFALLDSPFVLSTDADDARCEAWRTRRACHQRSLQYDWSREEIVTPSLDDAWRNSSFEM